ncbi:MAG: patatin [Candidatus Magnetoglobus multicellularis str. Araruama]|uniref:Patatin n=1 Tax=Candidatus Magnetoglobus multicellularis str. Araruama TaxID=890399 RepID=A0A1V1PDT9_9BACT|nr:MAG: patatin [Candidatus Magnetoglobus multicellularis str. Araruama]
MNERIPYNAVVFSGGGCRCFWALGFYEVLSEAYSFVPNVFAGVSAGATMACLISGHRVQEGIHYFKEMVGKNQQNIYIQNMFSKDSLFPHYEIYSNAIYHILDDQAFHAIKHGPDIRVLMAHPPKYLGPLSGAVVGFLTYTLEKLLFEPMHPKFPIQIGYRAKVVSVRSCPTKSSLVNLLLQSSCTPPILPFLKRDGKPVFDGGIIDNVPARIINTPRQKILVLLTKKYPKDKVPKIKDRTYVQPSRPIKIHKWDYTDPEGIQQTYDLGRRDAERFIEYNCQLAFSRD